MPVHVNSSLRQSANPAANHSADQGAERPTPTPLHQGHYFSRSLCREQSYAYFAPPGYDSNDTGNTARYPLLILLHGLNGNHLTWGKQTRLASHLAENPACNFFVAFPEGGDGWYTNAFDGSANYEDDLMQDFLPHLEQTLPLLPSGRHWAIGGMSMGGYGAVKIALQHGRLFSLALSHSGTFEFTQRQEFHPVFGDPTRDLNARRMGNVFKLAEDALSTWPPARPNLYFDCGLDDRWLQANRHFHQHLDFIGYRHTYLEQPGHHTLPYWDRALKNALPVIAEAIVQK